MNSLFAIIVSEDEKGIQKACLEKIDCGMMKLKNAGGLAEVEFITKKLEEDKNRKKGMFGFLRSQARGISLIGKKVFRLIPEQSKLEEEAPEYLSISARIRTLRGTDTVIYILKSPWMSGFVT